MLFDKILIDKWHNRLMVIFILSTYLRKLISYTVRVKDIILEDVIEMELVAKKMFKLCCLHENSVSPSLWTLCVITPVHTKCIFMKFGLGLDVNSMEGRDQKHQKIYKYMQNSTLLERWQFVFRHEFISCVYLKEKGFDQKRYNKRIIPYVPSQKNGYCSCGLLFGHGSLQDVCDLCDSREFDFILNSLQ